MSTPFFLSLFAGLTFALASPGLAAAQSSGGGTQSSDCTSTLLSPCRDTVPSSQTGYPQDLSLGGSTVRNSTGSQDSTSPYIDSAGRNLQTTDRQNQNSLFPPDPVTDFQRLAKSSTGEMLPIFGRDFFRQAPSTFAPGDEIGITPDYVIGPGDDLLLRFWGPKSFNSQLTVDRSGSIYVPEVGSIHVAGLHFSELQKQITTEMSRTYRNFNVSVNLGRLRSIQVYVFGEARRPGFYTISALSTALNALFASGGPNVQGSLRQIQVRRAGQTISVFDLYDLVLHGDKSKDVRLEQGDEIFIPPVGNQVAMAGSVKHPAIYELAPQNTLEDLIKIAGGFSATGSSKQVSLERVEGDSVRRAFTVALDASGGAMPLHDGDVVYAGHISAGYENSVTIRGNLANPGRFAWHEGMRLSEIIPDRNSLLTNDYWRERNRLGVPVPLFEPLPSNNPYGQQTETENVRGLRTPNNLSLSSNGEQSLPGQYQDRNKDTQPLSSEQVGLATAGLVNSTSQIPTDRSDLATSGVTQQPNQGTNMPQSLTDQQLRPQYGTDEQQKKPQQTKILLPAPEIDWSYAVIERLDPKTLKTSLVPFNLGELVMHQDAAQNLELQPGDVVTILSQNDISVPQEVRTKYVRLEGEFAGAGVYSAGPGETLAQLITRAGGLTSKAYLYGSSFSRESARLAQQQRLDEYISTLSTDMERSAAVRAASSSSGILDPNSLAEERSLIAQLRQMRATGRIVLDFRPTSVGINSIPNIPLENGDVFRVPSMPDTVSVIGAVYGQNVFLYKPDRRLGDYIALAGKPNRIADRKHAFIIRADGSVFSRERAQGVWTNNFDNARINPGDTIVIPEKLIKPTALKELVDYAQIASSFGLAAAAIAVVR